jgi:hypothetical protein
LTPEGRVYGRKAEAKTYRGGIKKEGGDIKGRKEGYQREERRGIKVRKGVSKDGK